MDYTLDQKLWIEQNIKTYCGKRRESSKDINFRCPFCGDSKQSSRKMRGHYYKNTYSYYCFNCGHSCLAPDLIAELRKSSLIEVKKELFLLGKNSENISKNITYKKEEDKTSDLFQASWIEPTEEVKLYLQNRFILKAPGLVNKTFYYDVLRKRLVIPWFNRQKLEYYQYRALYKFQEPKYLYPPELSKPIYGLSNLDPLEDTIYFTEGALDSIFIKNCVAVGSIFPTNKQLEILTGFGKNLVWISDNFWKDKASLNKIQDIVKQNPKMYIFNWPKYKLNNCKDINDVIMFSKNPQFFWDSNLIKNHTETVVKTLLFSKC